MSSAFALRYSTALVVALIVGCGGPAEPANSPNVEVEEPDVPPPRGAVYRHDVAAVVDAGLGRFLELVPNEPVLDGDHFVGFRILALRPPEDWQGVDLRPGDVVTSVNGLPIAEPEQAFAAFQSVRDGKQIRVAFLRGDQRRELVVNVVEKPGIVVPPAASAKAPAR